MFSQWQERCNFFPVTLTQSRLIAIGAGLMQAFNLIRQVVLQCFDVAQARQCVRDRLPLLMVQFHLVHSSPSRGEVAYPKPHRPTHIYFRKQ